MSTVVWIVLGLLVAATVWRMRQLGALARGVDEAVAAGDVAPLLERLAATPAPSRPTAFHFAVARLWGLHQRRLAVTLIRDGAAHVAGALTTQYWIRQALEVEPELAGELLDGDFLARVYQPRVAQQCGSFG